MKETIDLQERYRSVVSSAKSSLSLNDDHWKDAQMQAQKELTEHLTCELTQEKIRAQELEAMLLHGKACLHKTSRRVKYGSRLNTIQLWKEMIDEPLPEWAKDNKKVARSIVEAAVKQVVDAYSSNHAKQKLNPNHHFEVKYRSVRRTLTEVVRIQKDSSDPKKKHSTLLKFSPVPYTHEAVPSAWLSLEAISRMLAEYGCKTVTDMSSTGW